MTKAVRMKEEQVSKTDLNRLIKLDGGGAGGRGGAGAAAGPAAGLCCSGSAFISKFGL